MANLKIRVSAAGFRGSVRKLRTALEPLAAESLKTSADTISNNIRKRMVSSIGGGPSSSKIGNAITTSDPIYSGGDLFIGIGNMGELDSATQVMAKGSGETYYLWRLLEHGWGMKGGFGPKYLIEPVEPNRVLRFYMKGSLVFATHVWHPGARGHFFFADATNNWYIEDRAVVHRNLTAAIRGFLTGINFKG